MLEKWIGDDSFVTIIKDNYTLDFATKRYINRYLPNLYLQDYNCYTVYIHHVKNHKTNITTHVMFYYFYGITNCTKTILHKESMGRHLKQLLNSLIYQ